MFDCVKSLNIMILCRRVFWDVKSDSDSVNLMLCPLQDLSYAAARVLLQCSGF